MGEIVRSARNVHFGQSGTSRYFCSARHSGGPTTAQEQKHGRAARYQSDMRESGSGSGSGSRGGKGHESDPTSKSLRRSPSDFNAHVTSMCSSSSSDGGSSAVDAFVKGWLPGCTVREISDFMRITGKKSRNKSHLHLKRNLPAIASRLEKSTTATWRYRDISAVLYGLQCLVEDDDGYVGVVAAMGAALVRSTRHGEAVPFQSRSMAMIGLQKNRLRARQSVELLDSIIVMTKNCRESPNAQNVGNALYGMQSMSSDHAEVRSMVSALLGKVHSCKESLNAQNVGNALYGMQSMSSDHCASILAFLLRHITLFAELKHLGRLELLSIGQAVLLCIPSRRDVLDDASFKLWTDFGESVCSEHRRRIRNGECQDSFRSHVEHKMHRIAASLFGQSRTTVSGNDYLFDMFEGDIVVRIPFVGKTDEAEASADGKWLVINIEVDGMHHRQERKINFCKLRDAYLKSRGVAVHRIDASRVTKMEDNQVEQWLLDVTAESLLLSGGA